MIPLEQTTQILSIFAAFIMLSAIVLAYHWFALSRLLKQKVTKNTEEGARWRVS